MYKIIYYMLTLRTNFSPLAVFYNLFTLSIRNHKFVYKYILFEIRSINEKLKVLKDIFFIYLKFLFNTLTFFKINVDSISISKHKIKLMCKRLSISYEFKYFLNLVSWAACLERHVFFVITLPLSPVQIRVLGHNIHVKCPHKMTLCLVTS